MSPKKVYIQLTLFHTVRDLVYMITNIYSMYQNDWSSLEVDYIHKYGEQNYKY